MARVYRLGMEVWLALCQAGSLGALFLKKETPLTPVKR